MKRVEVSLKFVVEVKDHITEVQVAEMLDKAMMRRAWTTGYVSAFGCLLVQMDSKNINVKQMWGHPQAVDVWGSDAWWKSALKRRPDVLDRIAKDIAELGKEEIPVVCKGRLDGRT